MNSLSLFQVSEIELIYKSRINVADSPQIRSSKDCYDILLNNWSNKIEFIEEFNILLLNRANRVLGLYNISKGGYSGTVVDAKLVFSAALKCKASSIILSHNHPSGNLNPSQADIDVTKKLKQAGKVLDIPILDHVIITPFNYYSFADEGCL